MGRKFTIKEVKCFAEDNNFKLIDEVYINIKTNMEFKCNNCGEIVNKNFDAFKQRPHCPYCNISNKVERALIYTSEYIKKYIEDKGFELIEILEPKGINSKVRIKCNKCNTYFDRVFYSFKENPTCPKCRVNSRILPYEDVKHFIEVESNSGCILLTNKEDYYKKKKEQPISSMCKFKYKCACGNEFEASFNTFKSANVRHCEDCTKEKYGKSKRYTYEQVKYYIEVESGSNCKLLSEEYKGNHKPLRIRCACGNIFERALAEFKYGSLFQCRECTGAGKIYTYEDIKQELSDNNIELLSDAYINNQQKLKIKCVNGHITERSIENIRRSNYTCPKCNKVGYGRDTEQLREEIYQATKGEYELLSEYKTMNTLVTIKHLECGAEWETTPHNFLDAGNRCPLCRKSKGERRVIEYLDNKQINYKMEYSFEDLRGDFELLRFDFAIFDNKNNLRFLIEYDGEFHYIPAMGKENLKQQQRYDELKNNYCKTNNIYLLRIPYWEFDNLEEILDREFLNLENK